MILRALTCLFLILVSPSVFAQTAPAGAPSEQALKPQELEALVAPIALYPDPLLANVLMAATYPLEVVQADRWAKENKKLKGDQLKAEVDKQSWDETVKSLIATPDVLAMMSTKLDWTQKLGDAVLAQQPDVMDAVQRLRTKADANKKLASTKEQKVTKKQEQGKQVIVIEPSEPNTVYVPYYDPAVVYGGWPYPTYPPYYFAPPGYIAGGIIATGIAFGAGYALGRWASGGNYWGGGCNWSNNNITINRPIDVNRPPNNWQHRPEHRQGVRYNNTKVQDKFGNNTRGSVQNRMDFRGRDGQQVIKPGGGQANLGQNRPGGGAQRPGGDGGQRPGAGAGGGQRPSADQRPSGQRPGGSQRPSAKPGGGRGPGDALGNISSGKIADRQSSRGHASLGDRGGGGARVGGGSRGGGGGGARAGGGGGGRGGGGGGGRGGGGGGRRSDIALKHDIALVDRLPNGIGLYRFAYNGSNQTYVGVIAQDVQNVAPDAVIRGRDGYLRVFYDKIGVKFQTYQHWMASKAHAARAVRAYNDVLRLPMRAQ